jgi:hypothetical protein
MTKELPLTKERNDRAGEEFERELYPASVYE